MLGNTDNPDALLVIAVALIEFYRTLIEYEQPVSVGPLAVAVDDKEEGTSPPSIPPVGYPYWELHGGNSENYRCSICGMPGRNSRTHDRHARSS